MDIGKRKPVFPLKRFRIKYVRLNLFSILEINGRRSNGSLLRLRIETKPSTEINPGILSSRFNLFWKEHIGADQEPLMGANIGKLKKKLFIT
jgi:hypothetical protein